MRESGVSVIPFLIQLVDEAVLIFSPRRAAAVVGGEFVVALKLGENAGAGGG